MSHAECLTGSSSLQRPQSSSTHQGLPPTRFPAEVGGGQGALPGVEPRVPPIMTQHIHAHTHHQMQGKHGNEVQLLEQELEEAGSVDSRGQAVKGETEDEMVEWHHRLDGHEIE